MNLTTLKRNGSITFLDNQIDPLIQSKLTNSFSIASGKITYILSNSSKTQGISFIPINIGSPRPKSFPYSLGKNVTFVEGSYHKGSWCLTLRRGEVYQKSSNLDLTGSISFGNLGCHNGL